MTASRRLPPLRPSDVALLLMALIATISAAHIILVRLTTL